MTTSNKQYIGVDFERLYTKISKKEQGSKNFKQALIERDNKINEELNKLNLSDVKEVVIENLKSIKDNSKKKLIAKFKSGNVSRVDYERYKKFANKLQRWSYSKTVRKLGRLCEENGVLLTKVNPAYTSQICNLCGLKHENNRNGPRFKCLSCGYEADADYNAAVNISHRGVYSPSTV